MDEELYEDEIDDASEEGEPLPEDNEVLSLKAELEKEAESYFSDNLLKANLNESWVEGQQDNYLLNGAVAAFWAPSYKPTVYNYLSNIVKTFVSLITKDRPSVKAYPTTEMANKVGAADVANDLLDYIARQNNFDDILNRIVRLATMHSLAGAKVCYDPETDDIEIKVMSCFDFICEQQEEPTKSEWVITYDFIDKYKAKKILNKAGIYKEPVVESFQDSGIWGNQADKVKKGVRLCHIYYRPSDRYERGLYSVVCSGHVIDTREWPYWDNENMPIWPFAFMKSGQRRNSPFGNTFINDCIDIQGHINANQASLQKLKEATARTYLLIPSTLRDAVGDLDESGMLFYDASIDKSQIGWTPTPSVPPILMTDIEQKLRQLYDIAGINEITTGAEQARSGDSAKKIGYVAGLDAQKHQDTAKSMQTMIKDIFTSALRFAQTYFDGDKVFNLSSESGVKIQSFSAADLQGVDVFLEPISGESKLRPVKADAQKQAAAEGLVNQVGLPEELLYGLTRSSIEAHQQRIIDVMIDQILSGANVEPDDSLDPEQVINSINAVLAADPRSAMVKQDLDAMSAYYAQKLAPPQANPQEV